MNGSRSMTTELITGISENVGKSELSYDILVCPPAPYLSLANEIADQVTAPIWVGAQTLSEFDSGAYTGEVSAKMISELGCNHVLIGHSERREYFSESNEDIARKFKQCIDSDLGLTPVLCFGETLSQREAGNTEAIVAEQINAVIDLVGIDQVAKSVFAYEPVWAIGTGVTATPNQAQEVHAFIRALLAKHDVQVAESLRILYGGSVKAENALELFGQPDIDGGLIGGASLKIDSFVGICAAADKLG